jgi:NitT/TauT family transport system permease protein/sulfonate transport system permease protein
MGFLKKRSGLLLIALLVGLWQVSAIYWISSPNWPTLPTIAASLIDGIRAGELLGVFASTLYVMFVGYLIGTCSGVAAGLLMARVHLIEAMLNPIVELMRPIPIPAIIPPLILLFGIDSALKIFVVAFSVFFPVLINTAGGIKAVDPVAIDVGRTFRAGRLREATSILCPASLPYILAGMRISLSVALIVTVTAEMIAGSSGIGYFIIVTQYSMRAPEMYAAIVLLALLGYSLNRGFLLFEHRLLHWYLPAA